MSLIVDALKRVQRARSSDQPGLRVVRRWGQLKSPFPLRRGIAILGIAGLGIAGTMFVVRLVTAPSVPFHGAVEPGRPSPIAAPPAPKPAPSAGTAPPASPLPSSLQPPRWAYERGRDAPEPSLGKKSEQLPKRPPAPSVLKPLLPSKPPVTLPPDAKPSASAAPPAAAGPPVQTGKTEPARIVVQSEQPDPAAMNRLFAEAVSLHKRKQLDSARNLYLQVLAMDPGHPEANNNLGLIHRERGDLALAVRHFRKALEASPTYATALNNLGVTLYSLGVYEEALAMFERARALRPEDPAVYVNIGLAFGKRGDPLRAQEAYERALALHPASAEAHYNLAVLLDRMGRPREADLHFQQFLRLAGPEHGEMVREVEQRQKQHR